MSDTIFTAIITLLQTLSIFSGSNGTKRVYQFPVAVPDGYPYAVVVFSTLESEITDSARDLVTYTYTVSIVGEKFGQDSGLTQANALASMRRTVDDVIAALQADNDLGVAGVIRSLPLQAQQGYTDGNSRVVVNLTLAVQTAATITF
jgi:hypothetical protein